MCNQSRKYLSQIEEIAGDQRACQHRASWELYIVRNYCILVQKERKVSYSYMKHPMGMGLVSERPCGVTNNVTNNVFQWSRLFTYKWHVWVKNCVAMQGKELNTWSLLLVSFLLSRIVLVLLTEWEHMDPLQHDRFSRKRDSYASTRHGLLNRE